MSHILNSRNKINCQQVKWDFNRKRQVKAAERSKRWFKEIKSCKKVDWGNNPSQIFLFGVVVPDHCTVQNFVRYSLSLMDMGANGLVIGGANVIEDESVLYDVIKGIRQAVGTEVPILVQYVKSFCNVSRQRDLTMYFHICVY